MLRGVLASLAPLSVHGVLMASGRSAGVPHIGTRAKPANLSSGGAVQPPQPTANKPVTPGREKEPAGATEFGVTCYTAPLHCS